MHTKEEKLKAFSRLLDVMDALREKCPWNAEQTMDSLRVMTEEEVYELSDAILRKDDGAVCKEGCTRVGTPFSPSAPTSTRRLVTPMPCKKSSSLCRRARSPPCPCEARIGPYQKFAPTK